MIPWHVFEECEKGDIFYHVFLGPKQHQVLQKKQNQQG